MTTFTVGDRIRSKCCTDPVCHRRANKYLVIYASGDTVVAVPTVPGKSDLPANGGRIVHINPNNWELAI